MNPEEPGRLGLPSRGWEGSSSHLFQRWGLRDWSPTPIPPLSTLLPGAPTLCGRRLGSWRRGIQAGLGWVRRGRRVGVCIHRPEAGRASGSRARWGGVQRVRLCTFKKTFRRSNSVRCFGMQTQIGVENVDLGRNQQLQNSAVPAGGAKES